MIYPANQVSCPAKVILLTALFSNSKYFFAQLLHWPADTMWWWAKVTDLYDYVIHLITDLKWNINCYL